MRVLALTVLLMTAFLAGCTTTEGEGSASIYVKDAPTDEFSEIHVVFTKVLIHKAGGEEESEEESEEETEGESEAESAEAMDETEEESEAETGEDSEDAEETESDAGWITLFENSTGQDVDLLAASGDASIFLGEANLTEGKYTQIRIVTIDAYGIDLDGNRVDFTVSSGTLKIIGNFDVVAGEETKITVDFDLDASLKEQGNGNWRMTPKVGKTMVEQVDGDASGAEAHEEGELVA